jgi:hypothetical protein
MVYLDIDSGTDGGSDYGVSGMHFKPYVIWAEDCQIFEVLHSHRLRIL